MWKVEGLKQVYNECNSYYGKLDLIIDSYCYVAYSKYLQLIGCYRHVFETDKPQKCSVNLQSRSDSHAQWGGWGT